MTVCPLVDMKLQFIFRNQRRIRVASSREMRLFLVLDLGLI